MNKHTTLSVLSQGDVQLACSAGYLVRGGEDSGVVCFYIDPDRRSYISYSSISEKGCPMVGLCEEDEESITEIEFSDFKGWSFHAGRSGKSIAIALTRDEVG